MNDIPLWKPDDSGDGSIECPICFLAMALIVLGMIGFIGYVLWCMDECISNIIGVYEFSYWIS